jgi:hypothetical protein
MTEHVAGSAQEPLEVIPPVPVQVGHDLNIQGQAADYGSWMTYLTPAGADQARPVLPMEPARHRATILVSAPGAVVAGSGVWVGTMAQCQAAPPVGGFLAVGASVVIENNQALFLIGDGTNSLRVTVLQERWDSGQD